MKQAQYTVYTDVHTFSFLFFFFALRNSPVRHTNDTQTVRYMNFLKFKSSRITSYSSSCLYLWKWKEKQSDRISRKIKRCLVLKHRSPSTVILYTIRLWCVFVIFFRFFFCNFNRKKHFLTSIANIKIYIMYRKKRQATEATVWMLSATFLKYFFSSFSQSTLTSFSDFSYSIQIECFGNIKFCMLFAVPTHTHAPPSNIQ